ncbi:hypothetical protein [Alicyclobacillus mali (ex Roth et al. 2021)]|uniref:hypothetical protein n=1 Tax=Alicyclobacillus mali (ex Roth et al. 2021) TaxID=1123961 RepID=UPI000AA60886|nr:hypothetical protein [Alicyclobacillus mali (ex Roth et al. 2021)]
MGLWLRVAYISVMIALIVGLDVAFLRHHVWARLAANVGIVALFLVVYVFAFRRS